MKAYHATSVKNALAIIQSGVFRTGTWWAHKVEDALAMAGPVVFEGDFADAGFKNKTDSWQFHLRDEMKFTEICRCSTDSLLGRNEKG